MMKVLVVDDDRFILEVIAIMLKDQDYDIIKRSNVDDAIALLEAGQIFDLVITDIVMPEKDGTKLAKYVKESNPAIPVIAITAGVENAIEDYINYAAMFTDEAMTKPLHKNELIDTIKRLTVH